MEKRILYKDGIKIILENFICKKCNEVGERYHFVLNNGTAAADIRYCRCHPKEK